MNESKHTPGPWINRHWRESGEGIAIDSVNFRGPNVLAMVRPPLIFSMEKESYDCTEDCVAEAEANARLIAAAPDLLAACEAALATWKVACDLAEKIGATAPKKASWVPLALAAVARAKGGK